MFYFENKYRCKKKNLNQAALSSQDSQALFSLYALWEMEATHLTSKYLFLITFDIKTTLRDALL